MEKFRLMLNPTSKSSPARRIIHRRKRLPFALMNSALAKTPFLFRRSSGDLRFRISAIDRQRRARNQKKPASHPASVFCTRREKATRPETRNARWVASMASADWTSFRFIDFRRPFRSCFISVAFGDDTSSNAFGFSHFSKHVKHFCAFSASYNIAF